MYTIDTGITGKQNTKPRSMTDPRDHNTSTRAQWHKLRQLQRPLIKRALVILFSWMPCLALDFFMYKSVRLHHIGGSGINQDCHGALYSLGFEQTLTCSNTGVTLYVTSSFDRVINTKALGRDYNMKSTFCLTFCIPLYYFTDLS